MSTDRPPAGFERFSRRHDVEASLLEIGDNTIMLNESLSDASRDYDSTVVFSYQTGDTVALPLAASTAHHADWNRNMFRKDSVMGRRVLLAHTTLGSVLANPRTAGLGASQINTDEPQAVYTEVLYHNDIIVGALQHSFTPSNRRGYLESVPSEDEIESLTRAHRKDLATIAAHIALLQSLGEAHGPLGMSLELDEPIAPNSYVIRWDVEGSQTVPNGYKRQALDAYLSQAHQFVRHLTTTHAAAENLKNHYDDQGDGSYVILPLPKAYNPYNPHDLRRFEHDKAATLTRAVQTGLAAIGQQYSPELMPNVQVSGMFGYVEENSIGRLKSHAMFTLAKQKAK